jgi:hypothetical protein
VDALLCLDFFGRKISGRLADSGDSHISFVFAAPIREFLQLSRQVFTGVFASLGRKTGISDKWPPQKNSCTLPTQIANDKGRYHLLIAAALPPGREDVRHFPKTSSAFAGGKGISRQLSEMHAGRFLSGHRGQQSVQQPRCYLLLLRGVTARKRG